MMRDSVVGFGRVLGLDTFSDVGMCSFVFEVLGFGGRSFTCFVLG